MKNTIKKYLTGTASESEQKDLLMWLDNKKNRIDFRKEKMAWKKEFPKSIMHTETQKGLMRFQAHMMKEEFTSLLKLLKWNKIYKYAAVVMLFLMLGTLALLMKDTSSEVLYTNVIADNGQVSKIVLPDQSEVWLNSGSKLTYSNLFANKDRVLKLEGQAYFDVSHNAEIPLVVKSQGVNVKVLGTKFEVEAYPETNRVSVVLEEGSVEMALVALQEKIKLEPGEQAIYDTKLQKVSKIKAEKYSGWRKGILNIYDCPLSEVVHKLERRFNYKFRVCEELRDTKITLSIENENMEDVIHILENITPVEVLHRNDSIYFELKKE